MNEEVKISMNQEMALLIIKCMYEAAETGVIELDQNICQRIFNEFIPLFPAIKIHYPDIKDKNGHVLY